MIRFHMSYISIFIYIIYFLLDSVHAASLAASRVEQALSEAASSLSSFSPRPGPQGAWMIQLKIWLLLADVYLAIDQPHEAMFCIQEASQIYPLSHHIMYMVREIPTLHIKNGCNLCNLNFFFL